MPSHFSCVQLFGTLWTLAHEARLSMGILQAERILEWIATEEFKQKRMESDLGLLDSCGK